VIAGIFTIVILGTVFVVFATILMRAGAVVLQPESWKTAEVNTASMVPGLLVGDRILADRTAYDEALPERGDVILFGLPATPSSREQMFVLRVAAIPGDRIQMVAGVPVLNGTPLVQELLGEYADPGRPGFLKRLVRERLPNGVSYEIVRRSGEGPLDDGPVHVVSRDGYFLLSDNRDESMDSRATLPSSGTPGWDLPSVAIIGQAKYIYWSGVERIGRMGLAVK